jgi:hypothetical protein
MMKLSELADQLVRLKDRKDSIEEELKKVNAAITTLATIEIPKLMEDMGEEGFKCSAGTVFLQNKLYTSVLAEQRDALYKWLKKNKLKALIKEHVFPQTLTAFAKERLEKGLALPEQIKATFIPTASIRRNKTDGK